MHPLLARVLTEDEAACALVERTRRNADARIAAVRAEIASAREQRRENLQHDLERTIGDLTAEADADRVRRQTQRERRSCERRAAAEALVDRGVAAILALVRGTDQESP